MLQTSKQLPHKQPQTPHSFWQLARRPSPSEMHTTSPTGWLVHPDLCQPSLPRAGCCHHRHMGPACLASGASACISTAHAKSRSFPRRARSLTGTRTDCADRLQNTARWGKEQTCLHWVSPFNPFILLFSPDLFPPTWPRSLPLVPPPNFPQSPNTHLLNSMPPQPVRGVRHMQIGIPLAHRAMAPPDSSGKGQGSFPGVD